MIEYERSRRIGAPEDAVFAFLADARNLPTFLPTVRSVELVTGEHVRVHGEGRDGKFTDNGWFHVERARRGIEWGSDERTYRGWLTVSGLPDDASQVVVHLAFGPAVSDSGRPLTEADVEQPDPVAKGLDAALDSLRNLMEGTGGKEQPGRFVGEESEGAYPLT
jgi:uncharacterized protein YndB with AHSA1/START domain